MELTDAGDTSDSEGTRVRFRHGETAALRRLKTELEVSEGEEYSDVVQLK